MRAGTHKFVLKPGLETYGRVLDEHDNPIPGAKVWIGRKYRQGRQESKSDDEGRFVFRNVEAGETLFSVMAIGYEPVTNSHNISGATPEIIFRLHKGSVIAGRIVTITGDPIPEVRVLLEGSAGKSKRYDTYEFSTITDADGRFAWNGAPNQSLPFCVGKMGYQVKREVQLKPGEENTVTLLRLRTVEGQVVNGETSKPVTKFRIIRGQYNNEHFFPSSFNSKDFASTNGLFTIEIGDEEQNGIKVSARNYTEQIQAVPAATEEAALMIVKLKPSLALEGVVIDGGGRPVPGATVSVLDASVGGKSVSLSQGRLRPTDLSKIILTDANGRFVFNSPPETGRVAAATEDGFGCASFEEIHSTGMLKLQLLGRIEGTAYHGTEAVAGQEVILNSTMAGLLFENCKTTTDTKGHFSFEKVPAGILRVIPMTNGRPIFSGVKSVTVASEQTTDVILGGAEADLEGK